MIVLVTTDDLQPATLGLWKHWEMLKQDHPGMRLTAFVSVNNQEFGQENNSVVGNKAFKKWFEENKDWVEVAIHGYSHTRKGGKGEFLQSAKDQEETLVRCLHDLKPFLAEDCVGFKAPFYEANAETVRILAKHGVAYYSQWWRLNLLRPSRAPTAVAAVIGSHTGLGQANNPDNVDVSYEKLDKMLRDVEKKTMRYLTVRDYVRMGT